VVGHFGLPTAGTRFILRSAARELKRILDPLFRQARIRTQKATHELRNRKPLRREAAARLFAYARDF
jgi:hypothetical protein